MAKKQDNIIKPDFSALIARQGLGQLEPERSRMVTVAPAQVETAAEQTDTGRQERIKRARELVQEQDSGSEVMDESGVLKPLLIHETEKHKQNAIRYPEEIKFGAIERVMAGETIAFVSRDMSIPKRTMEGWLAEYREVREQQSVVNDFREIDLIEGATNELLQGINKAKVDEASVRDIGIAYGILRDKLKDIRGPKTGTGNLRLRATFRGEGAIELTTGDQ